MKALTNAEAIKEIRLAAKKTGMTFKRQKANINGKASYMFVDRESGRVIGSNWSLNSAFEQSCAGLDCLRK